MVKYELLTTSGNILLEYDKNNWCRISYLKDSKKIKLGADSLDIIINKLIDSIEMDLTTKNVGYIENVPVNWVLSLSEQHSSIYIGEKEGIRILFLQSADGSLLGSILINKDELKAWKLKLSYILKKEL